MKRFNKKIVLVIVQIALIAGSAYMLYSKLNDDELMQNLPLAFSRLQWWHFAVAIVLSTTNWVFDTQAWRSIMAPFIKLDFWHALKINVVAQSAGAITPMQAGDYGLRSYLLKNKIETRQNALLSLTFRLVKMVVRIVCGLLCLVYIGYAQHYFLVSLILAALLLLGAGFSIQGAIHFVSKTKQANRVLENRERINFKDMKLYKSFVPAIILYVAYSLQTALFVFYIDQSPSFFTVWIWVVITYSVTSFIPATGIFDPLIKSAFGALFVSQLTASPMAILFGFTITWLMNLGIPGLVSSLFFKRITGLNYRKESPTT